MNVLFGAIMGIIGKVLWLPVAFAYRGYCIVRDKVRSWFKPGPVKPNNWM